LEANSRKICKKGGFDFTPAVKSGDKADPMKVLGVQWESEKDDLSVACKVNLSAKKKGVNIEEDLDLDKILESMPVELTRRMIWRILLMQYDSLGLLCPIIIQLKFIMSSLIRGLANKKYHLLVFPNKIPFEKWTLSQANLEKVVQVLESDAASRSWKLATVEKVFEDSDKLVRKVLV